MYITFEFIKKALNKMTGSLDTKEKDHAGMCGEKIRFIMHKNTFTQIVLYCPFMTQLSGC